CLLRDCVIFAAFSSERPLPLDVSSGYLRGAGRHQLTIPRKGHSSNAAEHAGKGSNKQAFFFNAVPEGRPSSRSASSPVASRRPTATAPRTDRGRHLRGRGKSATGRGRTPTGSSR